MDNPLHQPTYSFISTLNESATLLKLTAKFTLYADIPIQLTITLITATSITSQTLCNIHFFPLLLSYYQRDAKIAFYKIKTSLNRELPDCKYYAKKKMTRLTP